METNYQAAKPKKSYRYVALSGQEIAALLLIIDDCTIKGKDAALVYKMQQALKLSTPVPSAQELDSPVVDDE